MKKNIKELLSKSIDLTDKEWQIFGSSLITRHYKKGEFFLKERDLCDYIGIVDKGFFYSFYLSNGVKRARGFFPKDEFIGNYPSFLTESRSPSYIEALEDSSVTLISKVNLFDLYKTLPQVKDMSQTIAESLYLEVSGKYESFFLKSAEDRYLDLITHKAEIIDRIPQYILASYIGVTPEGLSRIRRRLIKKTTNFLTQIDGKDLN